MKTRLSTSLSVLLALSASVASAQVGKTREEVRAELKEATRKGELLDTYTSKPMHELYPGMYPKRDIVPSTVTKAQVQSELQEAIRLGMVPLDEQGLTPREKYPLSYPALATETGKTREQVKEELKEASRNGDLIDVITGYPMNTVYPGMYPKQ